MSWVFLEVVVPVLLVLELADKAVRETALDGSILSGDRTASGKKRTHYLTAPWAVVAAAAE